MGQPLNGIDEITYKHDLVMTLVQIYRLSDKYHGSQGPAHTRKQRQHLKARALVYHVYELFNTTLFFFLYKPIN